MNSSGIKRGLAATAIGALAVTGLPAFTTSASAESINSDQASATDVTLYSQYTGAASIQNDGTNTTVHLLAGGGDDVQQVRFEYDPVGGGAPVVIATVPRVNGAFSAEWTPPVTTLNNTVDVRAVGLSSVGTELGNDFASTFVTANDAAVDIANAPGSTLGVFQQPYAGETRTGLLGGVTGTTSGTTVDLESQTFAAGAPTGATVGTANAAGIRPFNGTVDLGAYPFDTTAPIVNEAVIGADVNTGDSDDAEVVKVAKQTIGQVEVTSSPANPAPGAPTTITVTVTDAASGGKPVSGAQVVAEDIAANNTEATAKYTDANGKVTYTVNAPAAGAPATYDFFVNTSDVNGFQAGTDFRRSITISGVAQNNTTLTSASGDGAAFDFDENSNTGDLTAKLVDQNGNPVNNQAVSYRYTFVPFATPPANAVVVPPAPGTAITNAQGIADIAFTPGTVNGAPAGGSYTLNVFVESNGTPGQQAGELAAAPLNFKAGQSALTFDDAPSSTQIAGTTATLGAKLALADGTGLGGRTVNFTYGPTANSVVAAQANQPAGTTRTSDTLATAVTNATGAAAVAVSDPAAPPTAELNNTLDAATGAPPAAGAVDGNAGANGDADPAAAGNQPLDVDFVQGTPPADVVIKVTDDAGNGTPGSASNTDSVTVDVYNDANKNGVDDGGTETVEGLAVTLTVGGNAYFTDGTYTTPGAPGTDAVLNDQGQSIIVVTDNTGGASAQTSIGRDAGFDDDGKVSATVTATTGSASKTAPQQYDSANPINGGDVTLVVVPNQAVPTDPARTGAGNGVGYQVVTTDQFGNAVGAETVTVAVDGDATVNNASVVSDFDKVADFTVSDNTEETVTLTARWVADTTVYTVAGTGTTTGTETLTDTADQAFFEANFEDFNFDISQMPDGDVLVGSAVTEVVTVTDENGNPVEGLNVAFIRQGPGNQQDGDQNDSDQTNVNGQAFYTFTGTEAGTARVSAVITEDAPKTGRQIISDDVTFVAAGTNPNPNPNPGPGKVKIAAQAIGKNNGGAADRIKIKTRPIASRATVKLFSRANNGFSGKRVLLAEKTLNRKGKKIFIRPDNNGNRLTKYWVIVSGTKTTFRDRSNTKKLR